MRRTVGLFVGMGILTSILAGCGGGKTDQVQDLDPNRGAGREDNHPRPEDAMVIDGLTGIYGGRYVSTVRFDPKTWNVLTSNEVSTSDITNYVLYDGLVAFNNVTQETEPLLAKSWEQSDDGLEWIFHLRRGLRWSDGHPLTADDVIFSSQILYDDVIHPSASDLCKVHGKPFRFEKIDSVTVRITLAEPYGPFLNVIGSVYLMPKHKLEAAYHAGTFESAFGVDSKPSEIVTSGPWMLAEFAPQQRIVLKPNPYYFKYDPAGNRLPYLDELVYMIVPDQNADVLKFQGGESDQVYFRAEDYVLLKDGEESGDYTVYDLGIEMGTQMLWFNLHPGSDPNTGKPFVPLGKQAVFQDLEFRKAVAHAIDRESISSTIYFGKAKPLYGPIPEINRKWHNKNIRRYPHDLVRSRQILDDAGYIDRDGDGIRESPGGVPLDFGLVTNADSKERVAMSNIIIDDLAKIGIRFTLQALEFNTVVTKLRESFDYDAIMLGLTGGVPPDPIMSSNVFRSSGKTHFWYPEQKSPATAWEARVDSLMNAQISQTDPTERKRIFDEVQLIITENLPMIYTVSRPGFIAIRNKFVGLQPTVLRAWVLWESETISFDPQKVRYERARQTEE